MRVSIELLGSGNASENECVRVESLVSAVVHAFPRVDDFFFPVLGIHTGNISRPSGSAPSANPESAPIEVAIWTGSEHADVLHADRAREFGESVEVDKRTGSC